MTHFFSCLYFLCTIILFLLSNNFSPLPMPILLKLTAKLERSFTKVHGVTSFCVNVQFPYGALLGMKIGVSRLKDLCENKLATV